MLIAEIFNNLPWKWNKILLVAAAVVSARQLITTFVKSSPHLQQLHAHLTQWRKMQNVNDFLQSFLKYVHCPFKQTRAVKASGQNPKFCDFFPVSESTQKFPAHLQAQLQAGQTKITSFKPVSLALEAAELSDWPIQPLLSPYWWNPGGGCDAPCEPLPRVPRV